jgi:adenylyl-sulfate kinase
MKFCIWFTGLSGAGKSSLAYALHRDLFESGVNACVLDGDILRTGLNSDLDFSPEGRAENVRRVGEVAKLMTDAGVTVLAALISPYRADRDRVRKLFAPGQFIEVFVDAPLQTCMQRDVKGLYAKAQRGEVLAMTAMTSPYEAPLNPDLHLHTDRVPLAQCLAQIKALLPHTSEKIFFQRS